MNDNTTYQPGKHAFKDVGHNKYSSFWMDDSTRTYKDKNLEKLVQLSSTRKAVSNFVKIVTGKDIPVEIKGSQSYTDSKRVVISSDTDNFDILVGLALHEASHIAKSDFSLVKKVVTKANSSYSNWEGLESFRELETLKNVKNCTISLSRALMLLKDMANYVEDRRIDVWQVESSPGYKGYYKSFYNKYFYSINIDKGLRSQEMRDETLTSYEFRVINLHNPESDLDALNGLRDIYNVVDLKNISRLKNTKEAFDIAFEITKIIINNLDPNQANSNKNDDSDESQNSDDTSEEEKSSQSSDSQSGDGEKDESQNDSSDSSDSKNEDESDDGDSGNGGNNSDSSDNQDNEISREDLEKILDELKEKYDNNFDDDKTEADEQTRQKVNSLESSKAEYKNAPVGTDVARVLVLRKFDKKLIDNMSEMFNRQQNTTIQEKINEGLANGKLLGKKLKIRNDVKTMTSTRRKHGGIDKRLISELGYGNKRVFIKKRKIESNDVFMHITIDASGSMWLGDFAEALKMSASIAMAASMVDGFRVVISLRSDVNSVPYVLIAYDSDVDKVSKIRNLFSHLYCPGCTPEGLCYQTILDDIIKVGKNVDSYFVNMSDGYPGTTYLNSKGDYQNYGGDTAINHTAEIVKKISRSGINVISYLIDSCSSENVPESFKRMYGRDSHKISSNDIQSIAKILNSKFAKAANR